MQSPCLRQTIAGVGKSFLKDLTDGDIEIGAGNVAITVHNDIGGPVSIEARHHLWPGAFTRFRSLVDRLRTRSLRIGSGGLLLDQRSQYEPCDNKGRAEDIITLQTFTEQEIGEQGNEYRL